MNHTLFLHIETNVFDDSGFPTAIAWSLPDTRIKSVLIIPEDDWLEHYDAQEGNRNLDLDNLYNQGASPIDIVRELEIDLDGQYVYLLNDHQQISLLEQLFDAAQADLPFEPAPAAEFFDTTENTLEERLEQISLSHSLNKQDAHDTVMALLLLGREQELL